MSDFHMERGFTNMSNQIDDLKLDVPNAPQMFKEIVQGAIENKVLPSTFGK